MTTKTHTTLDEANIHAEVGSKPWSLAITGKAKTSLASTDVSASYAWNTIDLSRNGEAWKVLGYESFDKYLEGELEIDYKFFDKIGKAKSATNRQGKTLYEIYREDRTAEAAQEAEQEQGKGEGLKSHGTNRYSNRETGKPPKPRVDNINSKTKPEPKGGTGTKYTLAKFQRDISDPSTSPKRRAELQTIYDQIKAGELSVNAGAIQAGYRKVKTPLNTIKTNLSKVSMAGLVGVLTDEQRNELTMLLTNGGNPKTKRTKTTMPRPKLDQYEIPKLLQHPGILGNWTEYPDGSEEQAKAVLRGMFYCFFRLDGSRDAWYRCKEVVEKVGPWKVLGLKDFEETVEAVFGMPLEQVESIAPHEQADIQVDTVKIKSEPAKPKRTQPSEPQQRTVRVESTRSLNPFSDFNIDALEGTRPWANAITHKCRRCFDSVKNKANIAYFTTEKARKGNAWQVLGYDDFDSWFEAEVGISAQLYDRFEVPLDRNETIEEFVRRLAGHGYATEERDEMLAELAT